MKRGSGIVALGLLLFAALAHGAPPPVVPQPFVSGLAAPVEIAHANDGSGRLFVLEQAGRVRVVRNGVLLPTPFLDLSAANGGPVRSGGEQGLLGIAFHPSYLTNGRFFVFYTRALPGDGGGNEIVVEGYARSAANDDIADPASGSLVIAIAHPQFSNHNGGKMAFGPDGHLYIGVGDGGSGGDPANAAQTLTELRGKILRLDVDGGSYAIPQRNPFIGDDAARAEIWAYGLRNPWKFSFDRLTGDLFIGDVGQGAREEIDFQPRRNGGGRNYGWRVFEGTACFNPSTGCSLAGHVPPILEYAHDANGGFSVTGGFRYRGSSMPALAGFYLYGDFVSDRVWAAEPDASGQWITTQVATVANLSSFGEDENGELYAADLAAGTIVRLTPASAATVSGDPVTRYRLYNPHSFEHLYTTDANEYSVLSTRGWVAEGAVHELFDGPAAIGALAATPNFRLYHPSTGHHHWTLDANEYDVLPAFGWIQEGIDGYLFARQAPGTVPLYRLYHPAAGGLHLWTTEAFERRVLTTTRGWFDEGIAGYVLPLQ